MDNQSVNTRSTNQLSIEEKAAARESLQEMFHGSIDCEVVNLILSESDYNVEDAIEKLFTLANTTPVPATERVSQKVNCSESRVSPEMVVSDGTVQGCSKHPTGTIMYDGIDDISVGYQPQNQVKTEMSHFDIKQSHNGDSSTSNDVKTSQFSEPVQDFMKNYLSTNQSSNEWNSVKQKQNENNSTGIKEEKELTKHEITGTKSCRTSNANNTGMTSNDNNSTNSRRKPEMSVNDMKHIGSTSLPLWPDTNQLNRPTTYNSQNHHGPFPHTYNPRQFNPYQQKYPQMIGLTPNYGPPFHMQAGQPLHYNGPFVNQAYNAMYHQSSKQHMRYPRQSRQQELAPRFCNKQNGRNPPFHLPSGLVLVIMRGLPGSGKSTFAESIKGTGVVYSTDDYFMQNGQYQFDGANLGEAHEWNQIRAREAMKVGVSPVVIDNTNTQAWEMKPYIAMAQRLGYQVILKEPNTPWRWNAKELFRRNQHGVSLSSIKNMMDRYEHNLTLDQIIQSAKTGSTDSKGDEAKPESITNSHEQQPESTKSDHENAADKQQDDRNKAETKPIAKLNQNAKRQPIQNNQQFELSHKKCIDKQTQHINRQQNNRSRNPPQANTNAFGTRNKAHLEGSAIRSHGSRSPTKEFEKYMADEGATRDDTEQPITATTATSSPKPQREPRKRERRTTAQESLTSSENLADVTSEDCSKGLSSQEQKCDQHTSEKEQKSDNDCQERTVTSLVDKRECSPYQSVIRTHADTYESDSSSEAVNTCSQISTQSGNDDDDAYISDDDDAYVSDDEESDSVIVESDENDTGIISDDSNRAELPGKLSPPRSEIPQVKFETREEVTDEESDRVKLCEESDVELSGFEFLHTCFPEIDDKVLVEMLAEHNNDVNKVIETVLHNNERFPDTVTSQDSDSSNESSSDSSKDDVIPSKSQQDKAPLPTSHQPSFQISLEPVVAFHLFELFGPIKEVLKGEEFSASDLSVTVDMDFAKLLYEQWKKSIQINKGVFNEEIATKQARSSSFPKRKHKTVLKLQEPCPPPSRHRVKPTDLREIMHEQLAIEQSRMEQNKQESDMAVVLKRQKLFSMFPGVDPSALENLFEANKYELEPTVAMVQTSCNIAPKQINFIQDEAAGIDDTDDWSSVLHNGYQGSYQALEDPGYIDFRGEANMHHKLRDECFKKASLAFSQKQGQLAQFYAAQGHRHTEKIREANERAAARILEHKNADKDRFVLDLHGLHVSEAIQALQERLTVQDSIYKPKFISVVTGRGLHSKHGKAKIKPAVLKYLQDNNYRHEEMHAGQIKVYLK